MRIVQRKWPGRPHYEYDVLPLGEDGHGRWFGGPAGTELTRPDRSLAAFRHPFAVLIPANKWWFAMWNADPHEIDVYVNITDPPRIEEDRIEAFDLDLDVVRRRDGLVYLDDDDEFELHSRLHAYPEGLLEGARAAAGWLLEEVGAAREPFALDGVGPRWLAQARLLG